MASVHRWGGEGRHGFRVVAAAFSAWLVLGAAWAESPALDEGRRIYNERCYFCHGYGGDARTQAAAYLAPPPRDFTATDRAQPGRGSMIRSVTLGRPGTAMQGFGGMLSAVEIAAVVDFVRASFMTRRRGNTRYHARENGWSGGFGQAEPFATGALALDTPEARLTREQRDGRRLFLSACVSCHDGTWTGPESPVWEAEADSYPRLGFAPGDFLEPPDAVSSATPFARHDRAPALPDLDAETRRGERLYQANCAFCHAADGTGRNWIGTFLDPHPRDLTRATGLDAHRLRQVMREGLPGTSMPAWGGVLEAADMEALIRYVTRAFLPPPETPSSRSDALHEPPTAPPAHPDG